MIAIRATYINGQIVPDTPVEWPEGTRLVIKPEATGSEALPDDEDSSPEATARRLALMDRVEPWMTPEEEATVPDHIAAGLPAV